MSDHCTEIAELWDEGPEGPRLAATFTCWLPADHGGLHWDMTYGVWEELPDE